MESVYKKMYYSWCHLITPLLVSSFFFSLPLLNNFLPPPFDVAWTSDGGRRREEEGGGGRRREEEGGGGRRREEEGGGGRRREEEGGGGRRREEEE